MSAQIIELSDDSSDSDASMAITDTLKVESDQKDIVKPTDSHTTLMIKAVNINMPVKPYRCQVALMSMVITALHRSENCILESPTGTGKTLALLSATLAWQKYEQSRINQNQTLATELATVGDGAISMSTPVKKLENLNTHSTPEKLFTKPVYGERSIYDAEKNAGDCSDFPMKRKWEESQSPPGSGASELPIDQKPKLMQSSTIDLTQDLYPLKKDIGTPGLVTIHKKPNLEPTLVDLTRDSAAAPSTSSTPEKKSNQEGTQKKRLPIIYYGSRTHKQLEQVIKEFERTPYCGEVRMTVLSSRDYSCIREFDSRQWPSKNDMCRACIKPRESSRSKDGMTTDCKYYENRTALAHKVLPAAFNLQQLVGAGRTSSACPYYAARLMAMSSQIVFCPYNYLIDPAIRSNMSINLRDNILIIDEAHNIESVCRDAASFTVHRDQLAAAMKELDTASFYRFSNQGADTFIDALRKSLDKWDYWFQNQQPLLDKQLESNGEILFTWKEAASFVQTLDSHDVGRAHYPEFSHNVQQLLRRINDEPRAFIGIGQATCSLLETLETILGYLFKNNGETMNDFVMVLGITSESRYKKVPQPSQSVYLNVLCMNPGVVFAPLLAARTVVLASGTLAPLAALAAELGARFPHAASPPHVVPPDRVWIGAVGSGPQGARLRLTYSQSREPGVQDALGHTLVRACRMTPHGVLCFLPSYWLLASLRTRWRDTGLWQTLTELKHVFTESKNVSEHNDIMEEYYEKVATRKGALLMAVYRGKVAEGMDFRDHQARLVVAVGIPFPSRAEPAVEFKMQYNSRRRQRGHGLLPGDEWYTAQAFRALNQALGRCIRHRADWGAALLLDERFLQDTHARRLPAWLYTQLSQKSPYTYEGLERDETSLQAFMQKMTLEDEEENVGAI